MEVLLSLNSNEVGCELGFDRYATEEAVFCEFEWVWPSVISVEFFKINAAIDDSIVWHFLKRALYLTADTWKNVRSRSFANGLA